MTDFAIHHQQQQRQQEQTVHQSDQSTNITPSTTTTTADSARTRSSYRTRASDWGLSRLDTGGASTAPGEHRERPSYRPMRRSTRKYNKLELLQLYQPTEALPDGFTPHEEVTSYTCQEPLNKTFFKFEKDAKINPEFVYARGRGITASSPLTSSARGRGRGRGRGGRGGSMSLTESMPAWASETITRDEKPMVLRGFTDEERDAFVSRRANEGDDESAGDGREGVATMRQSWRRRDDTDTNQESTTDQQQQQQQQQQQAKNIDMDSMWLYKDSDSNIHGPFPLRKLHDWVDAAFFDPDLEVKQEADESFVVLKDVIAIALSQDEKRTNERQKSPSSTVSIEAAAKPPSHEESSLGLDGPKLDSVLGVLSGYESPSVAPAWNQLHLQASGQQPTRIEQPNQFQLHLNQASPLSSSPYGMVPPPQAYGGMPMMPPQPHSSLDFQSQQQQQHYYNQQLMQQHPNLNPWQTMPPALSVEQLEAFVIQNNVPLEQQQELVNQMALMNQMNMQQFYWNQMQRQQHQQQQQHFLPPASQEMNLPMDNQDVSQLIDPRSQIQSEKPREELQNKSEKSRQLNTEQAFIEDNPFDQTQRIEAANPIASQPQSHLTKVSNPQARQEGMKSGKKDRVQKEPAPVQRQSKTVFFPEAPIQPRAVPPIPEKPIEKKPAPQMRPAPVVIHAREDDDDDYESKYLYDRNADRRDITLTSALPQQFQQQQQQQHQQTHPNAYRGWGETVSASAQQASQQVVSLSEIQQEQDKQSKKKKKKERKQILEQLEQKSVPVWGGVSATSGPSLLEIQQQENLRLRKQQQKQKQKQMLQPSNLSYSAKVGRQAASAPHSGISQPAIPSAAVSSAWGSPVSGGKTMKDILAEEKRSRSRGQQPQHQQPSSLAEQLARNVSSSMNRGQVGISKPVIPSTTAKPSATAQHSPAIGAKREEKVEREEEDMLWDYSGDIDPESNVGAFSSYAANTHPQAQAQAQSQKQKPSKKKKKKSTSAAPSSSYASVSGNSSGGAKNRVAATDEELFPSLSTTSKKKGGKKAGGSKDASAFGIKELPDEQFDKWYQQQVTSLGEKYEPTLFYFLLSLETDSEVDGYFSEYFGSSNNAKKFADQFKAYKKHHESGKRGPFNPASAAGKSGKKDEPFKQAGGKRKKGGRQKILL